MSEGDTPITLEPLIRELIDPKRSHYLGSIPDAIRWDYVQEASEAGDIIMGHICGSTTGPAKLVALREPHELKAFKEEAAATDADCTFFRLKGGWGHFGNSFGPRRISSRTGLFAGYLANQAQATA